MNYTPKPNTGTMFQNNYKKSDNHPDLKGDLFLDRSFLKSLINETEGDLIKVSVSAWNSQSQRTGTEYISMSVSKPYVKPAESRYSSPEIKPGVNNSLPADDEDVPF